MRKSQPVVASSIDGKADNVEEHFKETYEKLYNSVDDKKNMESLRNNIHHQINT